MAISGLIGAGAQDALAEVVERRLKEQIRQQQEQQEAARIALQRDQLASLDAERQAIDADRVAQRANQTRALDLADLRRRDDLAAQATERAARSDMGNVLNMPGMSPDAIQREIIGSSLRTGVEVPRTVVDLMKVEPVKRHAVTVPGPGGRPTRVLKTEDELEQGVEEYREPKPPRATGPSGLSPAQGATALKFQDDYARDSKPYLTMRDAYQRVKSANQDAAGDLSLIFAYMKLLDPNSVVREQEFANAQNAAGVPDRVRNTYNQVMEGVRLNPEQRKQFVTQAEGLFSNARANQKKVRETYRNRAKQWEIPESMVLDADDEPDVAFVFNPQTGKLEPVRK